jgi:outer membrane protein TolC
LDIGDAWYQSLAAKQLARASTHGLEAQRQQTLLEAAQLYFDLTRSKALVEVAADALQASEAYRRQLHEAVVAGLAFKGDELRVQTQTKDYEILLRRAREQLSVSGVELTRVLHLSPTIELAPQDSGLASLTLVETNATAARLIDQALLSRPELKQGDALLAAAREDHKGAVYGPLIPSLSAQAFGGGLGGGPDGGPTHFGAEGDYLVGLSWRIGPGGLFDPGRVRTHQARVAQAELSEAKLRDDISAQVVTGLARVQSLADQIELSQAKLTAATETLRVTHERKQYGVGIVLEDLQAQQDLERARADFLNSIAEFNKAEYQLAKYVGSL